MSCCGLPRFWRPSSWASKRQNGTPAPAGEMREANNKASDAKDRRRSSSGNAKTNVDGTAKTRPGSRELSLHLHGGLKRHEIRLLTFKSVDKSPQLELLMQTVALGAHPYEALSYEWGDPGDPGDSGDSGHGASKRTIKVNDRPMSVSANLHEALDALRRQYRRSASRGVETRFWVDAICVNQRHAREKSRQVQMMGKIYSKADNVVLWLGPPDRDSNIAMRFFERWGALLSGNQELQAILKQGDFKQDVSGRLVESILGDVERLGQDKYLGSDRLDTVERFANRSYWARSWTLQEQVLARRGTIMCGNRFISASTFWSVAVVLFHIRNEVPLPQRHAAMALVDLFPALSLRLGSIRGSDTARDVYLAILDHCIGKQNLLSKYHRDCKDPILHTLLENRRQINSTDPRDRIYGLLGLVPDNKRPIQADYSMDASQVYTKFWTAKLKRPNGVKILGIVASQLDDNDHAMLGLPSWVPDFRGRLQEYVEWHSPEWQSKRPNDDDDLNDDLNDDDNAAPLLSWSPDGRELMLQGFLFDQIEDVFEFSINTGTLEQIWNCVEFLFRNYLTDPYSIRQADCPWTVTLFHAFMTGRRNDDVDAELILKDPHKLDDVILYYSILAEWAVSHTELDREAAISFLMPPDIAYNKRVLLVSLINKEEGRQMLCKALLRHVAMALGLDPKMVDSFPALAGRGVSGLLREANRKSSSLSGAPKKKQERKPRRRLLLTRDGYVGSIDTGAKKGDYVCLIPGCPRSLILRHEEDIRYERPGEKRCRLIGRANFPFMSLQTEYLTDIADFCLV